MGAGVWARGGRRSSSRDCIRIVSHPAHICSVPFDASNSREQNLSDECAEECWWREMHSGIPARGGPDLIWRPLTANRRQCRACSGRSVSVSRSSLHSLPSTVFSPLPSSLTHAACNSRSSPPTTSSSSLPATLLPQRSSPPVQNTLQTLRSSPVSPTMLQIAPGR